MPLASLVYVSFASHDLSDDELRDILTVARDNNKTLNVTGMLLYRDRFFIQVLEGEKEVVRSLFAHIGKDPRHHYVKLVCVDDIDKRSFGEWSMGFNKLGHEALAALPGYSDFLSQEHRTDYFTRNPGHATALLQSFKEQTYF
ncbi:MAG: BLUF domain-containing protein [bacterium]|nr:BLUF domain-containing protein [bacterium]